MEIIKGKMLIKLAVIRKELIEANGKETGLQMFYQYMDDMSEMEKVVLNREMREVISLCETGQMDISQRGMDALRSRYRRSAEGLEMVGEDKRATHVAPATLQ